MRGSLRAVIGAADWRSVATGVSRLGFRLEEAARSSIRTRLQRIRHKPSQAFPTTPNPLQNPALRRASAILSKYPGFPTPLCQRSADSSSQEFGKVGTLDT